MACFENITYIHSKVHPRMSEPKDDSIMQRDAGQTNQIKSALGRTSFHRSSTYNNELLHSKTK